MGFDMQRFDESTEAEQKRAYEAIKYILSQEPYISSKDKGVKALKNIANDALNDLLPVSVALEKFVQEAKKFQSEASGGFFAGVKKAKSSSSHALYNFLGGLNKERVDRLQKDTIDIGASLNRFDLTHLSQLFDSQSEKRRSPITPIGSPRAEQEDPKVHSQLLSRSKDTLLAQPNTAIDESMVNFMKQLPSDRDMKAMGNSAEGRFKAQLSIMIRHTEKRSVDAIKDLVAAFRETNIKLAGFDNVFSRQVRELWNTKSIEKISGNDVEKMCQEFDKIAHEYRRDNNKRFESGRK